MMSSSPLRLDDIRLDAQVVNPLHEYPPVAHDEPGSAARDPFGSNQSNVSQTGAVDMMDTSSDLMKVLVEAKQEELRHSNRPFFFDHEPGTTRRWMGSMLIRIGERIGGTPKVRSQASVPGTVAMQ